MHVHAPVYAEETLLGLEVEHEQYGMSQNPVCQVVEVGDDTIVLEDMLRDRTYEVPRDTMLRVPFSGREYTVYWKEHRNGRGEWVRTTPKCDTQVRATEYRFKKTQNDEGEWVTDPDAGYKGHELTRLKSETYHTNLSENSKWKIRTSRSNEEGEFTCIIDDSIEEIKKVYDGIDVPDDITNGTTVGWVVVHRPTGEVIRYSIEPEYRRDGVTGPDYVDLNVIDKNGPEEQDYEWDEVEYSP